MASGLMPLQTYEILPISAVQQSLVVDVSLIDTTLAENIKKTFIEFQDEFIESTQKTPMNSEQIKNSLLESQKKIIIQLKDYNNNILQNEELAIRHI